MPGKGRPFTKGQGGRPKGTPNKATADVKAALLEAFEKRGGVTELVKLKEETFYALLGKLLPREVKAEIGGELRLAITRSFVRNDDPKKS